MLANKAWDVAAGIIIAREAGAQVLDLDGTIHTPDSLGTVSTTGPWQPN
jgi:myo-inositol-1(or 4)-monophosphatase